MEASHRLKQAKHLPDGRNIQDGNTRMNKGLVDLGRMALNRTVRHLPSHPYPLQLKGASAVDSQVSILPIHLSALWASKSSTSIHNNSQSSEACGPLMGNQTSSVPEWLFLQGSISKKGPTEHKDHCEPNRIVGVNNQPGKVKVDTDSGVFLLWPTNTTWTQPL